VGAIWSAQHGVFRSNAYQTLRRYLDAQQPARTLAEIQAQLDTFVHYYNDIRPHRALHGRTPLHACSARIIALGGELIRELTLDPSRNYQPLQRP